MGNAKNGAEKGAGHDDGRQKGVAVITGASAGLGAEYARLFAADGFPVLLVARREDRLQELARELEEKHGVEANYVAVDLGADDGPPQVKQKADVIGLPVYALVNNAGFGTVGPFLKSDVEKELGQIRLNVMALTHLTHLFLPDMIERGSGHILNIGSTAGFQPGPYMAVYYATKAYVNSFTDALAYELRKTGVTATVHCPGPTATEFGAVSGNDATALFKKGSVASAADCARHGYAAMKKGKPLSIHGFTNSLLAQTVRFSPRSAVKAMVASLNRPA